MGVDITTYRSRIGTFRHGTGLDVILLRVCVNYSGGMKMVGTVTFIGLLLIMAGVEQNPGPLDGPTREGENAFERILRSIGYERFINVFKEKEIWIDKVADMTYEDFKNIGIEAIGVRKKIQKACKEYLQGEDYFGRILRRNGFERFINAFNKHQIGIDEVADLTDAEFQIIGIKSKDESLKVQAVIKQYLKENSNEGNALKKHDNILAESGEHTAPTKIQEKAEKGRVIQDDYYKRANSCENLSQSLASDSIETPDNRSTEQLHAAADNREHILSGANKRTSKYVPSNTKLDVPKQEEDSTEKKLKSMEKPAIVQEDPQFDIPTKTEDTAVGYKDATDHDRQRADHTGETTSKRSQLHVSLQQMVDKLALSTWFPGKISLEHVTAIDPDDCSKDKNNDIAKLPWIILKRFIMADSSARDHVIDEYFANENVGHSALGYFENDNVTSDVSPLDVFITIFYCCDAMLKQYLYRKLFMCKLAVPLVYVDPKYNSTILSLWPLRSIVIEYKTAEQVSTEISIIKQPTKFVVFARIGRPPFSKSNLLNYLISKNKHDIFFHKDCPLGMSSRYISSPFIETAWYLPGGNDDLFNEVVAFVNVRGDLLKNFSKDQAECINIIGNIFVITLDLQILRDTFNDIILLILQYSRLVVVLTNSKSLVHDKNIESCLHTLSQNFTGNKKIYIVFNYKNGIERNLSEMKTIVNRILRKLLQDISSKKIHDFTEKLLKIGIFVDETVSDCEKGKHMANEIISAISTVKQQEKWKETITAIQYNDWNEWSILYKKSQRSFNNVIDVDKLKIQMNNLKQSQVEHVSQTMKQFIKHVVSENKCKNKILYFIEWLKHHLDNSSRDIIPNLRNKYYDAWEVLKDTESNKDKNIVKEAEKELANASFGIEHIFREMGQIYQASICLKKTLNGFPSMDDIALAMATLITYGLPFEILDGDASNIPTDWIHAVLRNVNQLVGQSKIMTLSVLGIQSSGKSTLLNTMFGLQFAVSAGRCTRGVYMQLIRVNLTDSPFQYIMVIDSEGLRAPELREKKKDHDNELATFVIGLGDVTLLNIKGENVKEINDILDITVHAFLRLKVANKDLKLRQKCVFVHQNVSAVNAAEKMKDNVKLLVNGLNEMTKEAAYSENIRDIATFNDVIEFDGKKHVWYLPDLWHGDPPMAAVNIGYCRKVFELKMSIIHYEKFATCKSFKSLSDIETHARDLWSGILKEDFVFSFKNSLEIKAYLQMENVCKTIAWKLESHVQYLLVNESRSGFNSCQRECELSACREEISQKIKVSLDNENLDSIKYLETFFETSDYSDIIVNWKEMKVNEIRLLTNELNIKIDLELQREADIRKIKIMTSLSMQKYEELMKNESITLANRLKGKCISVQEKDVKFEEIWGNFMGQINQLIPQYDPIKKIFFDILFGSFFKTDKSVLQAQLNTYNYSAKQLNRGQLRGSVPNIGLVLEDISVERSLKNVYAYTTKGKTAIKEIYEHNTDIVLQEIDLFIKRKLTESVEIGTIHVRNMLDFLTQRIENIPNNKQEYVFTLKTSFKAKLYLFISCYAQELFQKHNIEYREKHGIQSELKKFKSEVRTIFDGCLEDRQSEHTAAKLFRTQVGCFVKDIIAERLNAAVICTLMNRFEGKYQTIIAILTNLANNDSFKEFITYIKTPSTYVEKWIEMESNIFLFNESSGKYYYIAEQETWDIFWNVNSAIRASSQECSDEGTVDDWVISFTKHMKPSMPAESLTKHLNQRTLKKLDIKNFKKYLKSEMEELEENVQKEFKQHNIHSVQWKKENPFKAVAVRIWGCTEACVFCGEPCSKAIENHNGINHSCIQHRPRGVNGFKDITTSKTSLDSCNFSMQSNLHHNCAGFKYLCNPEEKKACKMIWHPFKEFRKYLPSWDIEASSDMEETCKYWMWFMAKYKQDLAEYYSYNVDDVPVSWENYTKEQALESLRNYILF